MRSPFSLPNQGKDPVQVTHPWSHKQSQIHTAQAGIEVAKIWNARQKMAFRGIDHL